MCIDSMAMPVRGPRMMGCANLLSAVRVDLADFNHCLSGCLGQV